MPKKELKLTDCKGWKIKKQDNKKKFVSLLELPSFIHLNLEQVEKLKKHIYKENN